MLPLIAVGDDPGTFTLELPLAEFAAAWLEDALEAKRAGDPERAARMLACALACEEASRAGPPYA